MKRSFLAFVSLLGLVSLVARAQEPPPAPGISQLPSSLQATNQAPIDPAKDKLIRQLLQQTKEVDRAEERIMQGLAGLKQFMPRVPQKYWTEYREKIDRTSLENQLVRVYDKYFTTDDIQKLLAFYSTPAGKKLSESAVPILRESMEISQQISKQAGAIVAKDLQSDQFLAQPRSAGALAMPPLGTPPPIFETSTPTPAPSATP